MVRWKALSLAGLCCAVLAACASPHDAELLQPPDMTAELANASLAPASPASHGPNRVEYASTTGWGTEPELYPGSDRVVNEHKKNRASSEGITRNPNGYQLNFSDAELSELAKVILKDSLGINYVFDPRVQGHVTVSTGGAVSRGELLSILESVLGMYRGALIADGDVYRIVPAAEAGREAVIGVDYPKEAQEVGPGYGVSIVPLRYVSSETMTRLLDTLAPEQNRPQAVVEGNLLIIRGTGKERESLLDIVYMFDVDWMKGQSAGIFTLENAAPDEIIRQLQQVFQADGQGKGSVSFQSITRLNAILVLTQKAKLLEQVRVWISRLDRGGEEAENYYVYRVENGRAADLADLLMATFTGKAAGGRHAEESEVAPTQAAARVDTPGGEMEGSPALGAAPVPAPAATATSTASTTSGPGTYRAPTRPGSLATSSEGGESDASKPTGAIQITPDERNNKLLIKASGRDLRKILGVLRRIDKAPLQVLINATLAEVTLNDTLQYGVQFYLQNKQGSLGFSTGQSINIAPTIPGLNFIVGALAPSPKVVIDALSAVTSVRVVSSPSVVVLHNQPATLTVGDKVPYTVQSAVSVTTPGAPVVNSIQYQDTGVTLKVTPKINSNGLVTMAIEQEISTVAQNASADSLTPTISQRHITSTIAVQSGQMVVLGGLISETTNRTKHNIPILNKIPYLGDILGGESSTDKTRTELIVFLQPSVIRDPADASGVAEEMRARMQSMAPRAAAWDAHVEGPPREIVK